MSDEATHADRAWQTAGEVYARRECITYTVGVLNLPNTPMRRAEVAVKNGPAIRAMVAGLCRSVFTAGYKAGLGHREGQPLRWCRFAAVEDVYPGFLAGGGPAGCDALVYPVMPRSPTAPHDAPTMYATFPSVMRLTGRTHGRHAWYRDDGRYLDADPMDLVLPLSELLALQGGPLRG